MCAKVCGRYERSMSLYATDGSREIAHISTFSSSGRRARTSKMRFNGRANVSLLSFLLFFFLVRLAHTGGKLDVASWLTRVLHVLARSFASFALRRPCSSASKAKIYFCRYAIPEKLIIYLRRRYVFPVDARCAFNAFAAVGSMRGVLASALFPFLSSPRFSSFSRDTLFPVLIGNRIPNPG